MDDATKRKLGHQFGFLRQFIHIMTADDACIVSELAIHAIRHDGELSEIDQERLQVLYDKFRKEPDERDQKVPTAS